MLLDTDIAVAYCGFSVRPVLLMHSIGQEAEMPLPSSGRFADMLSSTGALAIPAYSWSAGHGQLKS